MRWSFKVYDKDGNGFIDKTELRAIIEVRFVVHAVFSMPWIHIYKDIQRISIFSIPFQSIYRIKRVSKKDPETPQLSVDEVCERIFKVIDVDGDGKHA